MLQASSPSVPGTDRAQAPVPCGAHAIAEGVPRLPRSLPLPPETVEKRSRERQLLQRFIIQCRGFKFCRQVQGDTQRRVGGGRSSAVWFREDEFSISSL